MRRILALLMIPLSVTAAQPTRTPGRHSIELQHGTHERTVDVHVPVLSASIPHPALVIVLHGAGGTGERYLDKNGWAYLSEEEGFIVAAPDGLPANPDKRSSFGFNPRLWNSGQLRAGSERSTIDDTAFLSALIDSLVSWYSIDVHRIFVTGHSNGAGMTFRLASQLSEKVAAIAPVAGHCWDANPQPAHPMPTMYVIGDMDPLVPFQGGEVRLPWGRKQQSPAVRETLNRWARALGCQTNPVERDSTSTVHIMDFGEGRERGSLVAYIIKGQGHGWPGGDEAGLPARLIGPKTDHFDATRLIWKFFSGCSVK